MRAGGLHDTLPLHLADSCPVNRGQEICKRRRAEPPPPCHLFNGSLLLQERLDCFLPKNVETALCLATDGWLNACRVEEILTGCLLCVRRLDEF